MEVGRRCGRLGAGRKWPSARRRPPSGALVGGLFSRPTGALRGARSGAALGLAGGHGGGTMAARWAACRGRHWASLGAVRLVSQLGESATARRPARDS